MGTNPNFHQKPTPKATRLHSSIMLTSPICSLCACIHAVPMFVHCAAHKLPYCRLPVQVADCVNKTHTQATPSPQHQQATGTAAPHPSIKYIQYPAAPQPLDTRPAAAVHTVSADSCTATNDYEQVEIHTVGPLMIQQSSLYARRQQKNLRRCRARAGITSQ